MEVIIEIGHKAWKNIKPNLEGHTHDWTVFVQGANGNEIKHIVEKVIFHLPGSFEDSERVKEKPPFVVSESTSKSIPIQIVVFFCAEANLGEVNYIYDVHISDKVVNISLMRKLTFSHPSKELKAKLLLAGGELTDRPKTPPVIMGRLLKSQAEADDEIIILNNVDDDATLNITYQKLDIMQELLKENENLEIANTEKRERIALLDKLLAFFKENFSCHGTQISNNKMGINLLKKKIADHEKEIAALNLQRQIRLNELFRIQRKRKNEENINTSVAVGNEKENNTQSSKFLSASCTGDSNTSEISLYHKNTSATTKKRNISKAIKLNGSTSVDLKSSQSKIAVTCNDVHNYFLSQSKNETRSVNDISTHSQNLCKNQNLEILDCHRNVSSGITYSAKSAIACDVDKSIKENSVKTDASTNKHDMSNQDVEEPAYGSSMETNSSLKISERKIIDAEKSAKGSSAEANDSLNKSEIIIMDGDKSAKENNCQKFPDGGNSVFPSLTPCTTKFFKWRKSRKSRENFEKNNLETSTSVGTAPGTIKTLEQLDTTLQKHNASSTKITNIKTSNSNCKGNDRKLIYFGDIAVTPGNTELPYRKKEEESDKSYLQNFRNVYQSKTLYINSICKKPHRDLSDAPAPLIAFLTEHCQKLAIELDRIKNSKFSNYRDGTNSLFYKLANIDTNPITEECCKEYLQSLIDYFTNPKTFDMATLIYVLVDYLCRDRVSLESLPTYIHNQDTLVFLTPSENCIISALYLVDDKTLPHLNGLIRNTLHIIHQVIISKKNVAVSGLASLCRVFMEICKRSNDRLKPLFLCCELLKLGHPLAPYLINSLASVWRDPFKMYDRFSVEENIVVDAIMYGIKEKPLLMDNNLWKLTQHLRSTYFPQPFEIDQHQVTQLLTAKIISRCEEGLFENLWMLALSVAIFVSKKSWDYKMCFRSGYILPNLRRFSKCSSEDGFNLFCNLYVDTFSSCDESPYEELLQYLTNTSFHQGVKFVQDCAAISLLKYIGVMDKPIPAPLRDWFLRNQDNPKLAFILDLYCKKVMESRDSFLLWDDVKIF